MTNEINLILTKLKLVSEIEESGAYICDKEHSKILYDYITNLQEENQTLKNQLDFIEEQNHIIDKLEKENKELKLELSGYRQAILRDDKLLGLKEENERLKEIINDDMTVYLKGLEDGKEKMKQSFESVYKSRNEKAIEYINENCIDDEFYINLTNKEKNIIKVLDILNGGDE